MTLNVIFTKSAAKDYSELNEPIKTQVRDLINLIEENGLKNIDIKPLTGVLKGYLRIRKGSWRLVISKNEENITIISILQRKDAYKKKK